MPKLDGPTFVRSDGRHYWYANDYLGTPRKVIDDNGRPVWSASSSSFGDTSIDVSEVRNNIRFLGQYYDLESGLHYNTMRFYDPGIGRYLGPDPSGFGGGATNLYDYARQNPVALIDVTGLRPLTDTEKNALRVYFGRSLNADVIDLDSALGSRPYSPAGNKIRLPSSYFRGNRPCGEVILTDPAIYSMFAHESLHVWQRQHGVYVTTKGLFLQLGYLLGAKVYRYNIGISDPAKMLQEFIKSNIEAQGQIWEDFVRMSENGSNVYKFHDVYNYVRSK